MVKFLNVLDKEITIPLNPESDTSKLEPEPVMKIGILFFLASTKINFNSFLFEGYINASTFPPIPKVVCFFIDSLNKILRFIFFMSLVFKVSFINLKL